MITKDNRVAYEALFKAANEVLGLTSDDEKIIDINDYFTRLGDLRDAVYGSSEGMQNPKMDPHLLILPTDEGMFEINANTRSITIPTDFSKNGIGVQGDHLAEIIYFSIDRYFDTTDLYDKEVFIQWESPVGQGLSLAINKSLTFAPGKVVFGWPLGGDITSQAGNVKFSVRFYEHDEQNKELNFSFSTLTATVKVNSALDFDIADKDSISVSILDYYADIYNGLRNSDPSNANTGDVSAVAPVFDTDVFTAIGGTALGNGKYNLAGDETLQFSGRAYFADDADTAGLGELSYKWYYLDKGGVSHEVTGDAITTEYRENTDITRRVNEYYYYLDNGNYLTYTGALPNNEIQVYKIHSVATPNCAGRYYLVAENKAGRKNIKQVTTRDDYEWAVAFAATPVLTPEAVNVILDEDNKAVLKAEVTIENPGETTYTWQYKQTEAGSYTDLEAAGAEYEVDNKPGYYRLAVVNTINKDTSTGYSDDVRVSYAATEIVNITYSVNGQVREPDSGLIDVYLGGDSSAVLTVKEEQLMYSDKVTYQWQKKDSNGWQDIVGETEASFTTGVTGTYQVAITNTYNGNTKTTNSVRFTIGA